MDDTDSRMGDMGFPSRGSTCSEAIEESEKGKGTGMTTFGSERSAAMGAGSSTGSTCSERIVEQESAMGDGGGVSSSATGSTSLILIVERERATGVGAVGSMSWETTAGTLSV